MAEVIINPSGATISQDTQSAIEAETNEDTYVPPDLVVNSPGVAKGWCKIAAAGTLVSGSHNVASITDTGTGDRTIVWDVDFADTNYICVCAIMARSDHFGDYEAGTIAVGSIDHTARTLDSTFDLADQPTGTAAFGDR